MKTVIEIKYSSVSQKYWLQLSDSWREESADFYDNMQGYGYGFSSGGDEGSDEEEASEWFYWTTCKRCYTMISLFKGYAIVEVCGHRSGCRWPWEQTNLVLDGGYNINRSILTDEEASSLVDAGKINLTNIFAYRHIGNRYVYIENKWVFITVLTFESHCRNLPWRPADWRTSIEDGKKIGNCTVYGDVVVSEEGESIKVKKFQP